MEGLGEDLRFAAYVAKELDHDPFTLVDVGCSGGIDAAFRVFNENLVAVGFDPNKDEVERLRRQERHDRIKYLDAFVDGRSAIVSTSSSNPWQRLSVARTLEIRESALGTYSTEQRTANNLWTSTSLTTRHVNLPTYLPSVGIDTFDFLKIDVDGADFAILQSCSELLPQSTVLGVGIEVNFYGDASPETNTFHNVDRFMREHGYTLFDLSVRRYSNRALPSRYCTTIPAQTEFGRITQGDALYLRDICAGPTHSRQPLEASKLIKLAALFSLFGMPDGAAEVLHHFADEIRDRIDISTALNLLVAQAQRTADFPDYGAYIHAFERDDPWFWPAVPQVSSDSLSLKVASSNPPMPAAVGVNWVDQMVPGPAGSRARSGRLKSIPRRGHVAYGPNARLQPGVYEAQLIIEVHPRVPFRRSRAYMDIAISGEQMTAIEVPRRWGKHRLIVPFVVNPSDAASGVEVRLHTNGRARLSLESVEILRGASDTSLHSDPLQPGVADACERDETRNLAGSSLSVRDAIAWAFIPGGAPVVLPAHYEVFQNYYQRAELQTRRWIVNNVREDWIIFDLGANVGVYSVLAGRLAFRGRVFAFEPTLTATMLSENLSANGVLNVSVVRRAVSDTTGARHDRVYRVWGQNPDEGMFDFVTLDDFCAVESLERIDFIKIDVDGYEMEAIRGAEQILAHFRPVLIVEINHALQTRQASSTDLFQLLATLGYRTATVLDHENFLFTPTDTEGPLQLTGTSGAAILLDFDRRPVLAPEAYIAGSLIARVSLESAAHEHGATRPFAGGIEVLASGDRWTYAASFEGSRFAGISGVVVVAVDLTVDYGCLGIGLFDTSMNELVAPEVFHTPTSGKQVEIACLSPSRVGHVVVRNADPRGKPGKGAVTGITIMEALPNQTEQPLWEVASQVDVAAIARRVGIASPSQSPTVIRVVGVEDLHTACGFRQSFLPPRLVIPYGLVDFTMERDDAPILEYFYSRHSPRKHFEFGTWEGFGALLCASSSSAEIWTLNLPDGERDEVGNPHYGHGAAASDAGDRIGWRYREAGLQERVHQLYGDSRDLDTKRFGRGTFDSVLVDGGHTVDVVMSDTQKAIELLRPGGWVIWHDFAPDDVVLKGSEAARGVIGAFLEGAATWSEHLETAFWIRPSNLCLARRKETE